MMASRLVWRPPTDEETKSNEEAPAMPLFRRDRGLYDGAASFNSRTAP